RARRRDRVAAAAARGARADPRLPEAPPPGGPAARHHAAGPLRAPARRAARPAPPAAVQRVGRCRRAAAEPRAAGRAGGGVRAALPERERERPSASYGRAAHVAEMRRLLHVAMTRARRGLVLAYAQRSDRGQAQPPSPFVEEARVAADQPWTEQAEQLFGPDET